MLDEGSLARLAEMGIDVYLPRTAAHSAPPVSPHAAETTQRGERAVAARAESAPVQVALSGPRVLLLAQRAQTGAKLLADVVRALRFARIEGVLSDGEIDVDAAMLDGAAGLVLFGDTLARTIGAALPAQRQSELAWVVTGDPATLARDAHAKRAFWSELRRTARALKAAQRA